MRYRNGRFSLGGYPMKRIAGRNRSTLTRKGEVRLYGNTEYAAKRDIETAAYRFVADLMTRWGYRHARILRQ